MNVEMPVKENIKTVLYNFVKESFYKEIRVPFLLFLCHNEKFFKEALFSELIFYSKEIILEN
jgi:hypothetical protein